MAFPSKFGLTRFVGIWDLDGLIRLREQTPPIACPPKNSLFIYAKDVAGVSGLFWQDDACVEHSLVSSSPPGTTVTTIAGNAPAIISEEIPVTLPETVEFFGNQINGAFTTGAAKGSRWSVLTNGDTAAPELIFASGDVIMGETCGGSAC